MFNCTEKITRKSKLNKKAIKQFILIPDQTMNGHARFVKKFRFRIFLVKMFDPI